MSIKCLLGFHDWEGCKCSLCGKIRDEQHDWTKDCEKCSVCGKTRKNQHDWSGCKCAICGNIRVEGHIWVKELCNICNSTKKEIFMKHLYAKIDIFYNLSIFMNFTISQKLTSYDTDFEKKRVYKEIFQPFTEIIDRWGWEDIEKYIGVKTPDELIAYAKENNFLKRYMKKIEGFLLNKSK
jgi:hypothetical protein